MGLAQFSLLESPLSRDLSIYHRIYDDDSDDDDHYPLIDLCGDDHNGATDSDDDDGLYDGNRYDNLCDNGRHDGDSTPYGPGPSSGPLTFLAT